MKQSQFYLLLMNTQLLLAMVVVGSLATYLFLFLAIVSCIQSVVHTVKEDKAQKNKASGLTKEKV